MTRKTGRVATCGGCATEFTATRRARKFCSKKCSASRFKKPKPERECPTCAKKFTARKTTSKFCSATCYRNRQLEKPAGVSCTCKQCSLEFQGYRNQLFCSRKCSAVGRSRKLPGRVHCLACGGELLERPQKSGRKSRRKYCSRECYRRVANRERGWRKKWLLKKCPVCGDEFSARWRAERECRQVFCSRNCVAGFERSAKRGASTRTVFDEILKLAEEHLDDV